MEGIRNYTVKFFEGEKDLISGDIYHKTDNVTAEQALQIMQAKDMGKKTIIINGNMYEAHQIIGVERNMEVERDETCNLQLTEAQKKSLDVRYLKHGELNIPEQLRKLAEKKVMPVIKESIEHPET